MVLPEVFCAVVFVRLCDERSPTLRRSFALHLDAVFRNSVAMYANNFGFNGSTRRMAGSNDRAVASAGSRGRSIRSSVLPQPHSRSLGNELVMEYQLGALTTCAAVIAYLLFRRHRRLSTIRDVPGPVNPSWIFGMSPTSLLTFSWRSVVLNVKAFKDISGIFSQRKLEDRKRGSSRSSGILFVGMVFSGYALPFTGHAPVSLDQALD